jgi:hypothetical protein
VYEGGGLGRLELLLGCENGFEVEVDVDVDVLSLRDLLFLEDNVMFNDDSTVVKGDEVE